MNLQAETVDPWGDRMLRLFWRKPAETLAERTRRRVSAHLIPVLFALYVLAYLDRVNVSAAELKMVRSPEAQGLGFDKEIVGFGAGIFFWTYWILEIPSTLSVYRWGARWVFCRILVLWGICATLVGFIGLPIATSMFGWLPQLPDWPGWLGKCAAYINGLPDSPEKQFYFFRLALGFFEGGFFPSVIVYLTYWFRTQDRAKAVASFMAAIPLSSAFGLPASGLLLRVNWFGLAGWRWVFILEGLLPIVAGFVVLWFLPNRPRDAKWLTPEERDWLQGELDGEHQSKQAKKSFGAWKHDLGMVALLTGVYFCLNVTSYGLSMFMPAIIKSQLSHLFDVSDTAATCLASLPFFMGFVGMWLNGRHSDRTHERVWHVAIPLACSSLGIFLAYLLYDVPVVPVLLMIFVVGTCLYAHQPAFWPIPSMFLGAAAAASAIGFINMVGNLGGSVGPMLVGDAKEKPAASVAQDFAGQTARAVDEHASAEPLPVASAGKRADDETTTTEQRANAPAERNEPQPSAAHVGGPPRFREGLKRLAPWPIIASVVILIVGYARRRRTGGPA